MALKTHLEMEQTQQHLPGGGCCNTGGGTGIMYYYNILADFVWDTARYYFYVLLIVLYPSMCYCFFFRFGEYPWSSVSCAFQLAVPALFAAMAFWSHTKASGPNDPGFLKWEHFRTNAQLQDHQSRMNWSDPVYRRHMASQKDKQAADEFDCKSDCKKCGSIKVEGTHHCSTCGVCVLQMDHHCPWTNNCVGYLTIKPFLLFLFYVTLLCATMGFNCYRIAFKRELMHVGLLINFIPQNHVREAFQKYFMTEANLKKHIEINNSLFDKQVKDEEEFGAFYVFYHSIFDVSRLSPVYSKQNFFDQSSMFLPLAFGVFTLMLFCTTMSNIINQTSLIDEKKREKYNSQIRAKRARYNNSGLSNYEYVKGDSEKDDSEDDSDMAKKSTKPDNLKYIQPKSKRSWPEVYMHIFGEAELSWSIFVPYYPDRLGRTIANESYRQLQKQK